MIEISSRQVSYSSTYVWNSLLVYTILGNYVVILAQCLSFSSPTCTSQYCIISYCQYCHRDIARAGDDCAVPRWQQVLLVSVLVFLPRTVGGLQRVSTISAVCGEALPRTVGGLQRVSTISAVCGEANYMDSRSHSSFSRVESRPQEGTRATVQAAVDGSGARV
jgi:hypothetical protein